MTHGPVNPAAAPGPLLQGGCTRPAVQVEHLTHRFGGTAALNDVSVTIDSGQIFGFLGPDGAGKTTLFRILTTLILPESGRVSVLGLDAVEDLWSLRRQVGYMPGRFSLYADLTVEENLQFFATVFGTTVAEQYDIIAPIYGQIEPFRHRAAGDLSGGMKQKLALSCALVHRPRILFLDEPTTGVDAVSRREFWDLLGHLRAGGITIVVSTPYMDEADRCDRVALIQKGSILATDTPSALTASYPLPLLEVRGADRYRMLELLRTVPETRSVYPFGDRLHYTSARADAEPGELAAALVSTLSRAGFPDARARPIPAGIEDTFMYLMGDA